MIPKIIHFCWMSGNPYPTDIKKCIDSWKKILPDYEIKLWDTNSFDINSSIWVKEAFEQKKYAFCADYIRLYALFNYGGIYLDSDVEVIKSYNNLLDLPYFMGFESTNVIEAATIATEKNNPFIKECLDYYKDRHFIVNGKMDTLFMPKILMGVLEKKYKIKKISSKKEFDYSEGVINLFPFDFFSPIDSTGKRYVLRQSENTYSIHHFASAWVDWKVMLLVKILGVNSPLRFKLQKIAKKIFKK